MQNLASQWEHVLSVKGLFDIITLSFLELILGIDNIIFISIAVEKLPKSLQHRTRVFGLTLALIVRTIMLFSIGWIISLKEALFYIGAYGISGKGLILISGGVFLIFKTWQELKTKIYKRADEEYYKSEKKSNVKTILLQIIVIDFLFSFDSILAAVGVSGEVIIMVIAVIISMILMMFFSGHISDFINKHEGMKVIALAFLIIIGGILTIEGIIDAYNFTVPHQAHLELNKNYAYAGLAFALFVEYFNIKERKIRTRLDLNISEEKIQKPESDKKEKT